MNLHMRLLSLTFIALVGGSSTAYLATSYVISEARAQGASEVTMMDAGVPTSAPVMAPAATSTSEASTIVIVDPIEKPGEAVSQVKQFWGYGGWQAIVLIIMMIAHVIYVRMRPEDKDGDGKPDLDGGWRSRTWSISGAIALVGVPALAMFVPGTEAQWNAVFLGVLSALPMLMPNTNPQRGASVKT